MASGENRPYRNRSFKKQVSFQKLQINDNETSSKRRQRLAQLEAEIAGEEDSATIVRRPPPRHGPSKSEQIHESKKKLEFIRARKNEITQLFDTMKRSQTIDLCFLIDCTGSMDPYIAQVKMKIDDLVDHCKMTFPDLVLKVAFTSNPLYQTSKLMAVVTLQKTCLVVWKKLVNFNGRLRIVFSSTLQMHPVMEGSIMMMS